AGSSRPAQRPAARRCTARSSRSSSSACWRASSPSRSPHVGRTAARCICMRKPSDNNAEFLAFYDVLKDTPPEAPTACAGWTAHELVAHLTAGAEEMADLVERTLRDAPERPTRGFEEREAPWRAVPDDELRSALLGQGGRLMAALDELY